MVAGSLWTVLQTPGLHDFWVQVVRPVVLALIQWERCVDLQQDPQVVCRPVSLFVYDSRQALAVSLLQALIGHCLDVPCQGQVAGSASQKSLQ